MLDAVVMQLDHESKLELSKVWMIHRDAIDTLMGNTAGWNKPELQINTYIICSFTELVEVLRSAV